MAVSLVTLWFHPQAIQAQYQVKETIQMADLPFVQGLEVIDSDTLAIGTGLYGQSALVLLDLSEEQIDNQVMLEDQFFGEGITYDGQAIWQLSWRESTVFKRDPVTLELIETYTYPGEGWGLAYDDQADIFWLSDGTSNLYQHHSQDFSRLAKLEVVDESGQAVQNMNELEYVDGYLYANIWMTNDIIKIDLTKGQVVDRWDLSSLVSSLAFEDQDPNRVLNGIAHINEQEFYITGKRYPVMWRIILQ